MQLHHGRIVIPDLFRNVPLHPFFLVVYPIAGLLAFNVSQIYASDAFKPILIALFATTFVLCALRLIFRSWQLAGVLTSLIVVWFFVYGHLYNLVKGLSVLGLLVGRHRYLIIIWSGIILAIALLLIIKSQVVSGLTFGLNIISLILLGLSIVQISAFYLRNQFTPATAIQSVSTPLISWTNKSPPPDIYYIVLDGYGRSDALKTVEGIDNSAFLDSLKQLGFDIAKCSQSNYTRTLLSLTSTFNMEYIQTLDPQLTPDQDTAWLIPYLKQNIVRQQLEQIGYKTIVFTNPWEGWTWDGAAMVYKPSGAGLLSPFEYLLLSTTAVRVYLDEREAQSTHIAYYTNYEDTLYTLDKLKDVPSISGPKFVFVHLIIPHSPFVFGPDGEYINITPYDTVNNLYTDSDHTRGYTAAITYIDKRMLEIIPKLIQTSKTPPIIILAGDHGTGESNTVTWNLEAFYVQGQQSPFYATITPVNIFRVLFDSYFNGGYGLLPDRSYFSTNDQYLNFQEIANQCN
jgi:Sulfatase